MGIEKDTERFFNRLFHTESGCTEYRGANNGGYGSAWFDGKQRSATHVAWFLKHGQWPHLYVLHRCDNPPCCNPDHLFLGTAADNIHDCMAKGRLPKGETHVSAKLKQSEVDEIRELCKTTISLEEIGSRFGLSVNGVSRIKQRRSWDDGVKPHRKPHSPHKRAMKIEFEGKTYGISELSRLTGVMGSTLKNRYMAGLRDQDLLQRKPYKSRSPLI